MPWPTCPYVPGSGEGQPCGAGGRAGRRGRLSCRLGAHRGACRALRRYGCTLCRVISAENVHAVPSEAHQGVLQYSRPSLCLNWALPTPPASYPVALHIDRRIRHIASMSNPKVRSPASPIPSPAQPARCLPLTLPAHPPPRTAGLLRCE